MPFHRIQLAIRATETAEETQHRAALIKSLRNYGCDAKESLSQVVIIISRKSDATIRTIQDLFAQHGYGSVFSSLPDDSHTNAGRDTHSPRGKPVRVHENFLHVENSVGARPVEGDRHHEHHESRERSPDELY